jgi:AcrR family transcriptional regulator
MGRPPLIDRDAVLAAGLAIADERGIHAVTMQAVADRLGVTPMALYRHVTNKADLLDGLVERLLTEFPEPSADLPWDSRLDSVAQALRQSARRHPGVFPLLLQRPATTPAARLVRDGIYRGLEEAGIGADQVARIERIVSTVVLGFAVSEVAGRFGKHTSRELDADFELLKRMLRDFIQSEKRPGDPDP